MSGRSAYKAGPYNNSSSRKPAKKQNNSGFNRCQQISEGLVEILLYGEELKNPLKNSFARNGDGEIEARASIAKALLKFNESQSPKNESKNMTVSLYISTASGKQEIVVQTNAQSLDLYIAGLADAIDGAIEQMDTTKRAELLASLLRNAFPVAFAIAGYKAERVSESRMLVCGAAAPGEANLLAHSKT